MPALTHAAIEIRCLIGFALFLTLSFLIRTALNIFPYDHPGRVYAAGRSAQGNTRIYEALSPAATARYLADR